MNSLRKWLYRPKRDDTSLMAQFYYADEELNLVAGELDSFDGRKDPERCTSLVNQLRQAQDKVLNICIEMMEELLPDERATRDFRAKFPDDVMQDTLAGQLWFGAECLAAGSSILNRESESLMMRPLAKAVTKTVENVRNLLREQCLKPIPEYTEKIRESLKIFDKLFAEFELNYVSAMVPVKSADEFEMQQNVVVLFSDTLQRAVKMDLISQDQIDYCDPALMFTVPRLAIVAGLVIFPDGPLRLEKDPKNLSELFRPFKNLLSKIRELLWTMSPQELSALEMCLCSMDEPSITMQSIENQSEDTSALYSGPVAFTSDFVHKFYTSYPTCRQLTPDMISMYACSKKNERSERKRDRTTSKSSRTRARQERQSEKFLSRLTGIEERPRAKRRSKKDLQSHSRREHFPSDQDLIQSSTQLGYSSSRDRSRRSTRQSDYSQSSTNAPSEERQISSFQSPESDSLRPVSRSRRHRFSNRSFRISTVVCACGSLRQVRHPQTDSCLYSQSDVDPGHQDCVCSPEPESTSREEADALFESFANPFRRTVEEISGQNYRPPDECLWPAANIQNCVNNAVISDPYVLSPFSICESEEVSTTTSHVGTPSSNYVMSVNVSGNLADDFQNIVYVTHDDLSSSCNCCGDDGSSQGNAPRRCPNACQYFTLPSQASAPLITSPSNELLGEPSLSPRSDAPQSESSPTSPRNLSSPDQEILQITTTPEVFSSAVSSPVQPGEFFPSEGHSTTPNVDTNEYQLVDSSSCTPRDVLDHDPEGVPSSASPSPEHSNGEDDREIALAMQAAEVAASWKARERFTDSSDLIQRLFVCISGVADQLQTNCASDMRRILRCVFVMNQTPDEDELDMVKGKESKSNKDSPSEDGSSTNGSEEYSVESAEDAMAMIGTPECQGQGQLHSADDNSDLEEDSSLGFSGPNPDDTEVLSPAPETRLRVRSGSVVVPPSVFNEHSLMQYSTLSPPPMPTTSPIEQSRLDEDLVAPESYRRNVFDDSSAFTSNQNEDGMIFSLDAPPDGPQFGAMELPSTITMTARAPAESSRSELDCDLSLLAPILASSSSSSPPATPTTGLPPDLLRASSIETLNHHRVSMVQEPPTWIPDHSAPRCMACGALFNVVRRRHHCRNCGKVFCGHCSRHSVPLPHFGIWKNVRVCNACFLYYVTSTADGSSALTS